MRGRFIAGLVAACVAFSFQASACSRVFPRYVVSSPFNVKILRDGKSVQGIRVTISETKQWTNLRQPLTDANGAVTISLPPGDYFVSSGTDQLEGEAAELTVVPDSKNRVLDKGLELHWPDVRILQSTSIRGTLGPNENFDGAKLELVDALSGASLGTSKALSFDFGQLPEGLYALKAKIETEKNPGWFNGVIAIQVSRTAAANRLDIDGAWTSCGLMYSTPGQDTPIQSETACGNEFDLNAARIFVETSAGVKEENDGWPRDYEVWSSPQTTYVKQHKWWQPSEEVDPHWSIDLSYCFAKDGSLQLHQQLTFSDRELDRYLTYTRDINWDPDEQVIADTHDAYDENTRLRVQPEGKFADAIGGLKYFRHLTEFPFWDLLQSSASKASH